MIEFFRQSRHLKACRGRRLCSLRPAARDCDIDRRDQGLVRWRKLWVWAHLLSHRHFASAFAGRKGACCDHDQGRGLKYLHDSLLLRRTDWNKRTAPRKFPRPAVAGVIACTAAIPSTMQKPLLLALAH